MPTMFKTDMLTQEAQGNHVKVDLYMVHAQDHLMTAITFIDLAKGSSSCLQKNG